MDLDARLRDRRLRLGDVYRCTLMDEREKFRCRIWVQTYAPVRVRNRPNRAGMETVFRLKLDPIRHRIPYVMIARARSLIARAGDDAAPIDPETVGVGSLIADLVRNMEVSCWGRLIRNANRSRSH